MDTEKSTKLFSLVTLFAIIDIPLAAVMIPFVYLIPLEVLLYKTITTTWAVVVSCTAVVALIVSIQGKSKVSGDEKAVFILALLSLVFMGACAGIFGNLVGSTANMVGPLDHIITHHEGDPEHPLALASMPFALLNLFMAIGGTGLSVLGVVASVVNIVNIKGTQARVAASTNARAPAAAGGSRVCSECGAANGAGAKFCKKCGKSM